MVLYREDTDVSCFILQIKGSGSLAKVDNKRKRKLVAHLQILNTVHHMCRLIMFLSYCKYSKRHLINSWNTCRFNGCQLSPNNNNKIIRTDYVIMADKTLYANALINKCQFICVLHVVM
jgi:hypothetical protein